MRIFAVITLITSLAAAAAEAPLHSSGNTVPDAYIVMFKNTASPADVNQHMEKLKEWNTQFPLRGEAGNLGIRVDDKDKDKGKGGSEDSQGGKNTGNHNQTGSGTEQSNQSESGNQSGNTGGGSDGSTDAVASGVRHTWFFEDLHYYGYSGSFSKEVLHRIRQDNNVAYVEHDQIVGIAGGSDAGTVQVDKGSEEQQGSKDDLHSEDDHDAEDEQDSEGDQNSEEDQDSSAGLACPVV